MTSELAATGRRLAWIKVVQTILVVVACLAAASAIYLRNVMKPRATPPPPLPSPNGYDDLVRAGGMIRGHPPNGGWLRGSKPDELRAWVASNAEALRLGREALAKPSRVPVVYEQDLQREIDRASALRNLGRLLAAESEVATREGRPEDAARSTLDVLHLGRATGRGGLLIDAQIGWAIESQALDGLGRVRDSLPADACRTVMAALLEADKDRETYAEARNAEDYWFERTAPFMVRLSLRVSGVGDQLRADAEETSVQMMNRAVSALRRELVALAERLYTLETGAEPRSRADLVPRYLPEIPRDPETGLWIGEIRPDAAMPADEARPPG
jgi:hypothetical protein